MGYFAETFASVTRRSCSTSTQWQPGCQPDASPTSRFDCGSLANKQQRAAKQLIKVASLRSLQRNPAFSASLLPASISPLAHPTTGACSSYHHAARTHKLPRHLLRAPPFFAPHTLHFVIKQPLTTSPTTTAPTDLNRIPVINPPTRSPLRNPTSPPLHRLPDHPAPSPHPANLQCCPV